MSKISFYLCKTNNINTENIVEYKLKHSCKSSWEYTCCNDCIDFYANNITTKLLYYHKLVPYIAAIGVADKENVIGTIKDKDGYYCCFNFLICFKPLESDNNELHVLDYEDREIIDAIQKQLSFNIKLKTSVTDNYRKTDYYWFRLIINKNILNQCLLHSNMNIDFNLKNLLFVMNDNTLHDQFQYSISFSLYIPVTIYDKHFELIGYEDYIKYNDGSANGDIIVDKDTNTTYIFPDTTNKKFVININSKTPESLPNMLRYYFKDYCQILSSTCSSNLLDIFANQYKSLSSNCIDCVDCIVCKDCKNCISCECCSACEDCINCVGCQKCYICSNIDECVDCKNCFSCAKLSNEFNKTYTNVELYVFDDIQLKVKYCSNLVNKMLTDCNNCIGMFNDLHHIITDKDKQIFEKIKHNYDKLIKCYKTLDKDFDKGSNKDVINKMNEYITLLTQYINNYNDKVNKS